MPTSDLTDDREPLTPQPRYTVHDAQREAIQSEARYRTLAWGRRAGKNVAAVIDAAEIARAPFAHPWGADDPAQTLIWWVSASYDQAKEHGFAPLRNALPNAWLDGEPRRSEPYQITLTNGVRIQFRTYDHPETLQGAGVDHLVVDEAAYMPRELWDDDLRPMLLDTEGSAMFISKPRGRGWFHEMYQRGETDEFPDHASFHATSSDNPFIAEDPSGARGDVPDRTYRREYLAEFVDESGGVFSELDDRLFTADYELPVDPTDAEPPFATGVDFARHQDHRVIVTLDATGDLVFYDRDQHEAWPQIQQAVEDAAETYDGIVAVDASRDNKIVADLEAAGVTVEPVTFSPQRKTELIEDLTASIESGELSSPEIPQLRHELEVFEYDVTSAGNVRYHAPSGFHDDSVDSLALALNAKRTEKTTTVDDLAW